MERRRTLYLAAKKGLLVRRDGPSLWIEEKNRAGRRVPVRLIGQAVIKGNVRIETGVITLLVSSGVPLTFIDHRGARVVTALLADAGPAVFTARVERLRGSPVARDMVRELFISTRKALAARLLREFLPAMAATMERKGLRESDYRECLETILSDEDERRAAAAVRPVLDGLFHEHVLRTLMDAGLDPHQGFFSGGGDFGLVRDVLRALEPEKERHALRFALSRQRPRHLALQGRKPVLTSYGYRDVVLRFENARARTARLLDRLLDGLFDIMRRPLP